MIHDGKVMNMDVRTCACIALPLYMYTCNFRYLVLMHYPCILSTGFSNEIMDNITKKMLGDGAGNDACCDPVGVISGM